MLCNLESNEDLFFGPLKLNFQKLRTLEMFSKWCSLDDGHKCNRLSLIANQRPRKITKTILSEVYCRGAPFWPNFIWPILSWISGNKLNLFCGIFLFRPTQEPDIERKFEWWKPKNGFKNHGSPNQRKDRPNRYLVKRTVDLQKHQNRVKLSFHLGL